MRLRKNVNRPVNRAVVVLSTLVGSLLVIDRGNAVAAAPETGAGEANAREAKTDVASLTWRRAPAAASCPGGAALERAVEQRVGRAVFAPAGGASLRIDGYAERDQARAGWRATLELSSADGSPLGRRELSNAAADCRPLGEMVVLAIALMIRDRDLLSAAEARTPGPPPSAAAPPSLVVTADPNPAPPRTWETSSDLVATLSAGLFPNPATGLRVRGVVRPPRALAFALEAALALPSGARFGPTAGGRFFGGWLGGAVCPLNWSPQPWRLRVCAGGSIGMLFFRPFGTDATGQQRRPLLVARVGAGLERDLGRSWFAVVDAELLGPAFRERFEIHDERGAHTLFQMTRAAFLGGIGIGRRF